MADLLDVKAGRWSDIENKEDEHKWATINDRGELCMYACQTLEEAKALHAKYEWMTQ